MSDNSLSGASSNDIAQTNVTVSGNYASPLNNITYSFTATKIGNLVTLRFPSLTGTTNSVPSTVSNQFGSGFVPVGFRPATDMIFLVKIRNDTNNLGLLQITSSTGVITFYGDTAGNGWTVFGVNFAIGGMCVSYNIV